MTSDKRLIEVSFPVKEVSSESAREKNIRHGHISTLHIWWARRPLAASRATAYAALIPPPEDDIEWEKQRDFIIELSKWENSTNTAVIEKAKAGILLANKGVPPKVLDPFAGGGSIPLEVLRLGCDTYANDYNPIAVLIEKCTLEYPQKYGFNPKKDEKWGDLSGPIDNSLRMDVKKWSEWVLNETKKEISQFYPIDPDGSIPIGYFWARTIPCQNPSCGSIIPLIGRLWLVKKANKKIALFPFYEGNEIKFKLVGTGFKDFPDNFNPDNSIVSKKVVTCPICGSVIESKITRKLLSEKKTDDRLIAVVSYKPGKVGRTYRIATKEDYKIFLNSQKAYKQKSEELRKKWGIEPIPDEPTPEGKGRGAERAFAVRNYSLNSWGDLFNSRQKLALLTFSEKIKEIYPLISENGIDEDYAKAISTYIAFVLDTILVRNTSLNIWDSGYEKISNLFGRQVLQVTTDYIECNPFNKSTGGWEGSDEWVLKVIDHCSSIQNSAVVTNQSSIDINFPNDFFNAIFTDPPYYDNVPYSYLSDFFYVWLKRTIGDLYPDLFISPLTPKRGEIVTYSYGADGFEGGKKFFENMLKKSFKEIHRLLKTNGISIIVYAHKSTEGWETLINSLLDSGLIMTGAWPLKTEMKGRLRSHDSAALASSIYIIARKMERQPTGFYNNVKEDLKIHLNNKLERLWQEGISGADFFIAAIGSAIEVFGKYEQVMDYEGTIVRADRLLVDVRKIATDYAVRQILHNGFVGEISDLARFYVLWRWYYGEGKVPFDEARKLGQSCGIDISQEWSHPGFVKKEKEFIRLRGPQDRKLEDLGNSKELIDVLHQVLLLWEKSSRDEIAKILNTTGFGKSEAFYRVAQAISETLPIESKEKKLLDGFLAGRERLRDEMRREAVQTRLNL